MCCVCRRIRDFCITMFTIVVSLFCRFFDTLGAYPHAKVIFMAAALDNPFFVKSVQRAHPSNRSRTLVRALHAEAELRTAVVLVTPPEQLLVLDPTRPTWKSDVEAFVCGQAPTHASTENP